MDINGKVALVTGAGSGIGRATAVVLGAGGASVAVVDRDAAAAEAVVAAIVAAGGVAIAVTADVATPEGVRAMFEAAELTFGGVDIVHNNAGLITGEPGWPDAPLERIAAVIAVMVAPDVAADHVADAGGHRGGGARADRRRRRGGRVSRGQQPLTPPLWVAARRLTRVRPDG